MTDVVQHFEHYLDQRQLEGEAVVDNGELILTVEGKAVHGMDPSLGVNAGLYLIDFLSTLNLNQAQKNSLNLVIVIYMNLILVKNGYEVPY